MATKQEAKEAINNLLDWFENEIEAGDVDLVIHLKSAQIIETYIKESNAHC